MVEIIPKPKEEVSIWTKILFYFSLIILLGTIVVFFVLSNLQKKSENYIQNLEKKILSLRTKEIISLERELQTKKQKIEDFSQILSKHILVSKFFTLLEENTHPKISFSKMDLDLLNKKVSLSGLAEDFTVLNQQIQIFEKITTKVDLTQLSFLKEETKKEGKIGFSLDLYFDEKIFKY